MRWFIAVLAFALTLLQLDLWLSDDGLPGLWAHELAIAEQTVTNEALAERNDALEAEIADLRRGGEAVEERARSELGMVKPSEYFYQIYQTEKADQR
ncbi:MAG: septum formation initiator family protein [Gammaproteobacteria bacterium]|nr:septum formation initiator family protein [Gammaproteobacteria bacterium]